MINIVVSGLRLSTALERNMDIGKIEKITNRGALVN